MSTKTAGIVAGIVIILLAIIVLTLVIRHREKSKKKVRCMCMQQKIQLLNELAEPFGFGYIEEEKVFTSRVDAWQRKQGYEALYDKAAAGANMVIDAWPVYFDYEGRTWLIEFWKGQYGINVGGEAGVYHAEKSVPPHLYPVSHFDAVENAEMPHIQCRLECRGKKVYELCGRHWWLTGFWMGSFSKPSDLRMMTTITFWEEAMAQAFFEGLQKSGQPGNKYRICRNEVYVCFDFSRSVALLPRMHRAIVQCVNRIYCKLYRAVTHPFVETEDRLLFLYFQIPACFRRMFGLGKKRYRKKRGSRGRV